MISFFDLAPACRTVITTLCFVAFCLSSCVGFTVYRRSLRLPKILMPVCSVVSGASVVLYSTVLRVARQDLKRSDIADSFAELPIVITVSLLLLIFGYCALVLCQELRYRKNVLTRSSIKEGIDKVSSGLCFYDKSGRVILMNHRMDSLCREIVGRDLQNAALFYEILSGGETLDSVERLSGGEAPSFRLSDGSVWAFARQELDGIIQLTAGDITALQTVTDELKEKNASLAALNLRLREYGEHVDELTRSRERLEVKVRIHRELGQTLLSSRQYLLDSYGTHTAPIEQWKRNIAVLRKEAEIPTDEKPMAMLVRAARTMNVELAVDGELPDDEGVSKIFVQAAAEALTNAISHAEAKTLFISLSHSEVSHTIKLRNDGKQPRGEITEGGGLGSLRKRVESVGGEMSVSHAPEFLLTVTLPCERGDF